MGQTRIAIDLDLVAGVFASQPLVFAHLADLAPDADLDAVEVIAPEGRAARLAHLLGAEGAGTVMSLLAADETVVVFLPGAGLGLRTVGDSTLLRPLGRFPGVVLRARPGGA